MLLKGLLLDEVMGRDRDAIGHVHGNRHPLDGGELGVGERSGGEELSKVAGGGIGRLGGGFGQHECGRCVEVNELDELVAQASSPTARVKAMADSRVCGEDLSR